MVSETNATIANVRITTTKGAPFRNECWKGKGASKLNLSLFSYMRREPARFCRQMRTTVAQKGHLEGDRTGPLYRVEPPDLRSSVPGVMPRILLAFMLCLAESTRLRYGSSTTALRRSSSRAAASC